MPAQWTFNANDTNFDELVLKRSRDVPVVVDFWSPDCAPCRMLGPILEGLVAQRQGDVLLAKVNIDDAQELAMRYGIRVVPTVIAFKGGQAALDFEGLLPEPQLREFLDRICPSQADRLASSAAAFEKMKPTEAEKLYRQALGLDDHHLQAQLGLARLLVAQGNDHEALGLLENAVADGEIGDEVERLKAQVYLRELAKPLGDEATLRHRLEMDPKNAQVHYELGCVVAAAGRYPEALELLLAAGEKDPKLAAAKVREAMVKIFQIIGIRSPMADDYRNRLSALLY